MQSSAGEPLQCKPQGANLNGANFSWSHAHRQVVMMAKLRLTRETELIDAKVMAAVKDAADNLAKAKAAADKAQRATHKSLVVLEAA